MKISVEITYGKSLLLPLSPTMSQPRLMVGGSGGNYKKRGRERREEKGEKREEREGKEKEGEKGHSSFLIPYHIINVLHTPVQ
jgi:hypothetical protein